jgi:hypothetical protein
LDLAYQHKAYISTNTLAPTVRLTAAFPEKPNIRFTFKKFDDKPEGPVIAPATKFTHSHLAQTDGTFGFVMELTPDLKAILERVYDSTKVAMIQDIFIVLRGPDGQAGSFMAKALVYWDPLYTADGVRKNVFANVCEREKWKKGLMELKRVGVPDGFLHAVQRRLTGERVDPEPLFAKFPRQPKRPMPIYNQRFQHNHHQHENRPPPQTSSQVAQKMVPTPPSSSSKPNTSNVQHKTAIQGVMGPPSRPSTAVQSQPVNQVPMGQIGSPISCPPMVQQNGAIQGAMGSPIMGPQNVQRNSAIQGQGPVAQDTRSMHKSTIQHQPAMQNLPVQGGMPMAQHHPTDRNTIPLEVSLPNMSRAQRTTFHRSFFANRGRHFPALIDPGRAPLSIRAIMAEDRRTLQIAGTKRSADSGEDRLMEELKRMKRDGHTGGMPALP